MKRIAYPLIPLLVAVSLSGTLQAQKDSAMSDLGSVRLQKQFTQYISIKGELLEKMPFANLAEAINVWLYGAYSNATTLVYVVDGNIVPDVNAWSVYDIEEVLFAQNALTQLTGNTGQQQLVLITTRRRPGKQKYSLAVAGASAAASTDYKNIPGGINSSSETNLYHQYHLSGLYTREKIQLGVSANWLHDVLPPAKGDTTEAYTPAHINRFRLHAWANVQVGSKSNLYLAMSAAPENAGQHFRNYYRGLYYAYEANVMEKQLMFSPYLQFSTRILPGLQNQLSVSWQLFNSGSQLNTNQQMSSRGSGIFLTIQSQALDTVRDRVWVIRDNISWNLPAGQWTITPAVYLQYAHVKEKYSHTVSSLSTPTGGLPGGASMSASYVDGKGHVFTAAPSLDFSYKQLFSVGGGAFAWLPPSGTTNTKQAIFPFAHFSLDFLKTMDDTKPSSLQLFASIARNYNYSFNMDALDDLTGASLPSAYTYAGQTGVVLESGTGSVPGIVYATGDLYKPHTVWTAGLGFRRPEDRLVLNYFYEERGFTAPIPVVVPWGTGTTTIYTYPALQALTHHINATAKLAIGSLLQWQTGITATSMKIKGTMPPYPQKGSVAGDLYGHRSWTGGWINRIGYKRFTAGLDLLYHIGEYQPSNSSLPYQYRKINSFDLQYLYAGYKLKVGKVHDAEVYIAGRNLIESNDSDLSDRRRYGGAGFKMML